MAISRPPSAVCVRELKSRGIEGIKKKKKTPPRAVERRADKASREPDEKSRRGYSKSRDID